MTPSRKVIQYDNRRFWQVTERSAIRHRNPNRLEVLTWDHGEVVYKSRTVSPSLYNVVKSILEGLA